MRAVVRFLLIAAAVLVPVVLTQSAIAAMHAKLSGVIAKENMGKHSVILKTTKGKTFLIYTNKATKYTHLKSFESLRIPHQIVIRIS
jgi:low affinity Fe/Cu permease